jgi:hypothetical protein
MNKFLWKIEDTCLDYTPITIIKNAVTKQKAVEISAQVVEYSNSDHSKEFQKFNEDNNPGCWRGFPLIAPSDTPGLSDENKKLIQDVIMEAGKHYQASWPAAPKVQVTSWQRSIFNDNEYDVSVWFNINQKGAANMIHNHHGAFFSGVFYFQAEGTGAIRFYPDNFLSGHTHPMWPYKGSMIHEPEDGDLLLFPAHLLHDVEANPSDTPRINCAFNVSLMPRQVPT